MGAVSGGTSPAAMFGLSLRNWIKIQFDRSREVELLIVPALHKQ